MIKMIRVPGVDIKLIVRSSYEKETNNKRNYKSLQMDKKCSYYLSQWQNLSDKSKVES